MIVIQKPWKRNKFIRVNKTAQVTGKSDMI